MLLEPSTRSIVLDNAKLCNGTQDYEVIEGQTLDQISMSCENYQLDNEGLDNIF